MNESRVKELARAVIETEAQAVSSLLTRVDSDFYQACEIMLGCEGRIVVLGMGKSGHIGGKIAATLASTGSPAFFVHPGEASHGDLGMITSKDVVLALSNSGETGEILTILPIIKRLGVPLIALTGNATSTLSNNATIHIDVSVEQEACPLRLAPTSSTTACLVMGDALAVALLEARDFSAEDFARSHPGGRLGRRLLLHVSDIMHTAGSLPAVQLGTSVSEALKEMTQKGLGMTAVVDSASRVVGVFTDGDLRRMLDHGACDVQAINIEEVMLANCKTTSAEMLAVEALQLMDKHKINALPVVDDNERLIGALNMHDLLRSGVV